MKLGLAEGKEEVGGDQMRQEVRCRAGNGHVEQGPVHHQLLKAVGDLRPFVPSKVQLLGGLCLDLASPCLHPSFHWRIYFCRGPGSVSEAGFGDLTSLIRCHHAVPISPRG